MPLDEYKRKRRFHKTPEPEGKVEAKTLHRFVVQKHAASHLHYDFRLEMEGVLKSWAVPKGPSLDPADKRLAMMVEDHPISYIDFEGIIPQGNYGAGTVMVWDAGSWQPLGDALQMLEKGDLKFRLDGQKLKGEFVLARMKSRRPGAKGNEWLLIKKRDAYVREGYDINDFGESVLTKRTMEEIAGDRGAAQWASSRKATRKKAKWLFPEGGGATKPASTEKEKSRKTSPKSSSAPAVKKSLKTNLDLSQVKGAVRKAMPSAIHPMLATLVDKPFNSSEWLFEIKWDGYRSVAFLDHGQVRLVSRNQNEMTHDFPEMREILEQVKAKQAIVDGEIVALDEAGRPSFSLMQQRSELLGTGQRRRPRRDVAIVYYAFDLLHVNGYSLFKVDLERRKELLQQVLVPSNRIRYSDHFLECGEDLYRVAAQRGLEGIVAKRRQGCYLQKRSSEWLKIKITQHQECVIGGYTDPRGSRPHFGSLVLGLYDETGRLVPVGQAGSGFTHQTHAEMWQRLKRLESDKSPFAFKPEATRGIHYVKPEMVAEIKFTEWTHEGQSGAAKMRAPIFQGLRPDKPPRECRFEVKRSAIKEAKKAEGGEAA